jgi:hypothetical protein
MPQHGQGKARTLLERYSPVVQYDSQESFAADSAATMTDCVPSGFPRGNVLCRRDGTVLAAAAPDQGQAKLGLRLLAADRYADEEGTAVEPDDYLDAIGKQYVIDARSMHARPGYADQIYGHAVRDSADALWLQYWFFYYYNNKAFLFMGLHEGDWEMIQLRLGADGEPDAATYAQHSGGERAAWSDLELDNSAEGPVPFVYSARGSHASYFRRGTYPEAPVVPDHNDAGGPRVRPQLVVIGDQSPSWAAWPGRWGSTRADGPIGSNSPPGPRQHGAWRDPLGFHNAAKPARELGPAAGTELPRPPAPEITPRRENDQAIIAYRFPSRAAGAPAPARLVLSLDAHKDGRPPATGSWAVGAKPGEIHFPLRLEERDYTVRASAASEDGITSATTTAPLPNPAHSRLA